MDSDCFYCLLAEKDHSESDSNDKVNLCFYCISCGVDFPFLIELDQLLKLTEQLLKLKVQLSL